jgi:chromosomal replication initiator protein
MNSSELWQATYRVLEQSILSMQLSAWIQPLEFVSSEYTESQGIRLTLAAPTDFSAKWVRDHYQKAIEDAIAQLTGQRGELFLTVRNAPNTNASESPSPLEQERFGENFEAALAPPPVGLSASRSGTYHETQGPHEGQEGPVDSPESEIKGAGEATSTSRSRLGAGSRPAIDRKYTFETYVVGASNQFAHASAVAVAEQPARLYNPLFLYSQPGLGKTHLLHAIANHLLERNPAAKIGYLSAETFVNELIDSIQHKKMSHFRTKYRDSFDLLLIDDIQFIAGKKQTEEEFFHTFNALHSSRRQIVVTSDRPPKEIEDLEDRIRTRFEWGMVADIQPPEIETRIAILKAKAERDDIYMPDEVATFLATYIRSNVRELEGTLIKLQMQASLTGGEISLEMAKQLLKQSVPEEGSQYTVESIQAVVAKHFQIKAQDFKSSSRARQVALPRQIAMYLIRKYTGLGYKEIGHYFGGKDHSTIVHACQKIETELETDQSLRESVESVQNLL